MVSNVLCSFPFLPSPLFSSSLLSSLLLFSSHECMMYIYKYIYRSGGISSWEAQLGGDLAAMRRAFQRSESDTTGDLSEPAIHFTHPGVVIQSNYDTVNTFLLQVMGTRHVLLFPHSEDMYPYPNIHRSYSYSQLPLEEGREGEGEGEGEVYPGIANLAPLAVTLGPTDMLFIPAYWCVQAI